MPLLDPHHQTLHQIFATYSIFLSLLNTKNMLSRAFTKSRRSPQAGETSLRSSSIYEYEEFIFGFMDDKPLVTFNGFNRCKSYNSTETSEMTLREMLRASVGVIGESPLGLTEKVVLPGGKICGVKRFGRVFVRKREFGARVDKLAQVGNQCEHLVPLLAYLYAKRIKFVVSDYYPMGSLADLLSGAKEQGQTALKWLHRLMIVQSIAEAISFIHSQNPHKEKNLYLNVHGNIKSSNVMVNVDFTARLSDYGFVQLAEPIMAADDTGQASPPASPPSQRGYAKTLSQKSDIYNFGVVLLDILECPKGVKKNDHEYVECSGKEQKQASRVLDIALSCTNNLPDARPTIDQVLSRLGDVYKC